MHYRMLLIVTLFTLTLGTVATLESKTREPTPRQVLRTGELMKLMFDPYYVELHREIEISSDREIEWRTMYVAAARLAESTNLLYCRQGEKYQSKQWKTAVSTMQSETLDLLGAIKREDLEQSRVCYTKLVKSCNRCHQTFDSNVVVEP